MPMPTTSSTDVTSVTTPYVSICSIASTSDVCREIDATRRVPLVERQAEPLEVHEHAAAEVEQHVLSDPSGDEQEPVERRARRGA